MPKILTPEQATRAVYFDFEGCVGETPSLLGWSFERDDGIEHFRQRIVEPALRSAVRTVPHTMGRVRCRYSSLGSAVERLLDLSEEHDRLIVSWAQHDLRMIEEYLDDDDLVQAVTLRYRNALPTARQWLKRCRPATDLEKTRSGRHRLAVYQELMGIHVPEKYGPNVAAKGIRAMREAIEKYGSFASVPVSEDGGARAAWKAVLGHNRLDCSTTREVVGHAATELAAAAVS